MCSKNLTLEFSQNCITIVNKFTIVIRGIVKNANFEKEVYNNREKSYHNCENGPDFRFFQRKVFTRVVHDCDTANLWVYLRIHDCDTIFYTYFYPIL